jgi:signal transduction histidine kinase
VEAHGGKIHAESAPARGAAFHVVLPLAPTPTIASHGA